MTRKDAKNWLNKLYARADITDEYGDMEDMQPYEEALDMAIQALEQEPCDDEYIKVPKKALKYRTAGMVAYNAEWLKNHFDIERAVICGAQEPCEDAISRQAVFDALSNLNAISFYEAQEDSKETYYEIRNAIKALPSAEPRYYPPCEDCHKKMNEIRKAYDKIQSAEPKTGHWISRPHIYGVVFCSKCGFELKIDNTNYCPNCGACMKDGRTLDEFIEDSKESEE